MKGEQISIKEPCQRYSVNNPFKAFVLFGSLTLMTSLCDISVKGNTIVFIDAGSFVTLMVLKWSFMIRCTFVRKSRWCT